MMLRPHLDEMAAAAAAEEEEEKQKERQAEARQRAKATGKNGTRAPRSACCWRRSATVRPTTCARCTGTAASGVAS
jgi:DNA invertase Pin-like site-specific DNA recombinase